MNKKYITFKKIIKIRGEKLDMDRLKRKNRIVELC